MRDTVVDEEADVDVDAWREGDHRWWSFWEEERGIGREAPLLEFVGRGRGSWRCEGVELQRA